MNISEAYEYALSNGRARAFSTFYVRALSKGKSHDEAVSQAISQIELSSEDAFSPSAQAIYALHYRRAIGRGADEFDARKVALEQAMRVMDRR
jgi:hypothetical protein